MTPEKEAPDGFKWITVNNAYGEDMNLLTADLDTEKGRELLQKAYKLTQS